MLSIFLQESLAEEELLSLRQEFPQYDFQTSSSPKMWSSLEVLFGNQLDKHHLELAPRLRWIHSPSADIETLCIEEIRDRKNILVTNSKGQNGGQIAEFVMGAILSFAKHLFLWPNAEESAHPKLKESMWSLHDKVLLQIGLGEEGSAIVKSAIQFGMKTWGIRHQLSFHPYCKKVFSFENLHSLLPFADVVVVALSKKKGRNPLFGKDEFNLMKEGSIFIVVGLSEEVDLEALTQIAPKFRGVLLDTFSLPKQSPLRKFPLTVLTPKISNYPLLEEHLSFRLFRSNLRLFTLGKAKEMKNIVIQIE